MFLFLLSSLERYLDFDRDFETLLFAFFRSFGGDPERDPLFFLSCTAGALRGGDLDFEIERDLLFFFWTGLLRGGVTERELLLFLSMALLLLLLVLTGDLDLEAALGGLFGFYFWVFLGGVTGDLDRDGEFFSATLAGWFLALGGDLE